MAKKPSGGWVDDDIVSGTARKPSTTSERKREPEASDREPAAELDAAEKNGASARVVRGPAAEREALMRAETREMAAQPLAEFFVRLPVGLRERVSKCVRQMQTEDRELTHQDVLAVVIREALDPDDPELLSEIVGKARRWRAERKLALAEREMQAG